MDANTVAGRPQCTQLAAELARRLGKAIIDEMDAPRLINDVDKFLSLIVRSGLVAQQQLDELVAVFRQDEFTMGGTVAELISFLTRRGVLTPWQCRKLREGKYKGFFLDQYKLLDHLADDDNYNYYLAQDTTSGKYAKLRIHQPKGWWNRRIEYDAEDTFD